MKCESHESIPKSLQFYRKEFGPKSKPSQEAIVDLGSQFEKFYESVRQVVFSRQNQIYLFFGLEGNGKKTVIEYCVNKLNKESYKVLNIIIDARVYKTEKLFLEEFYRKLLKEDEVPENVVTYCRGQSFLFSEIDTVIKDIKPLIMITVENFCDLSKSSRQVLLYSLLDWIRTSNVHIVIVGLVKDLMFLDLLEKRVKSRLSFVSFNFFKYSFEELKDVIARRITTNPNHPALNNLLVKVLHDKETEEFLRYFYLGQRPIEWFINLFRISFCLMSEADFEGADPQAGVLKVLKKAVQLIEPEYHKEILSDLLPSAELVLIVVIKRLIEQGRSPLNFMLVLDEIKDLKRRTNNFSAISFAEKTLLKAYENLHDLNFIRLEGSCEKGNKLENFDCVLNVNLEDLRDFLKDNSSSIPSFLNEWAKS